jgi:hypothetical protein
VSDRTAGRRTALQRTVKSRGPDASEVGVKSFGGVESPTGPTCHLPGGDGGKKARYSGESAKYAVKPLRRECRIASAALYARVRVFLHFCTRDRRCSAHPAFPAPSDFKARRFSRIPRAQRAARTKFHVRIGRHCEEPTGRADARPMTGSVTKQSILFLVWHDGLLRFARNDGFSQRRSPPGGTLLCMGLFSIF